LRIPDRKAFRIWSEVKSYIPTVRLFFTLLRNGCNSSHPASGLAWQVIVNLRVTAASEGAGVGAVYFIGVFFGEFEPDLGAFACSGTGAGGAPVLFIVRSKGAAGTLYSGRPCAILA